MTPSPFTCPIPDCGLRYRRKEHLTRHAKSHSNIQSFTCPFCDKEFARNDTLRHHVRSRHQDRELELPSSRATRACNHCRARRSKCDGQNPCTRCSRQGRECSYQSTSDRGTCPRLRLRLRLSSIPRVEGIESSSCRIAPFVQAYFEKFHAEWPFLHPATFDYTREPGFLSQSVVMMGMWASMEGSVRDMAKDLHYRLIPSIYEQRDKWAISEDPETVMDPPETPVSESIPWPLATYQGILLQIIFSLLLNQSPFNLGLTTRLPDLPSQLLKTLVHSCRQRKLFSYPAMLSQFTQRENPEVFIWVGIEEVKRFGLCLYRVCQRARLHGTANLGSPDHSNTEPLEVHKANLLSLRDLDFALPDSEELWHLTSGLAGRVAGRSKTYELVNAEGNWISRTARLLQPLGEQFRWV